MIEVAGVFYGTSLAGGSGDGTVYSITVSGEATLVHAFKGSASGDGNAPLASLTAVGSTLYGTTISGGRVSSNSQGKGTVFAVTPDGNEKIVSDNFSNLRGAYPESGLAPFGKSAFIGSTHSGGAGNHGTLYVVTVGGGRRIIHSFSDSPAPDQGEVRQLVNAHGTYYGVTSAGGQYGDGTVFSITPNGVFTVLHSFGATGDGQHPKAGLTIADNRLYGTTGLGGEFGNGIVFEMTFDGTETIIGSMPTAIGSGSDSTLLKINGKLYGSNPYGGALGEGAVFQVNPKGDMQIVHSFGNPRDGEQPVGNLVYYGGALYGVTNSGGGVDESGRDSGDGTFYSIQLN